MERVLSWLNQPLFPDTVIRVWMAVAAGAALLLALILAFFLIRRKKKKKRGDQAVEEPITERPEPLPELEFANLQGVGSREEQQDAFGTDGEETVMAWKLAVEEHRPVALVLSRQNIKTLPTLGAIRREEAAQVAKGGYVVMDAAKPAAVLIATGSEVATLVEGAELLAAEGIPVRVVNVPSEGLFRDQPRSYQESVLPAGVARYGMTSGLPVNLRGLVGENGVIHGLDHFGWSAPYKVLDEKFGYNGATVAAEVKKMLGK